MRIESIKARLRRHDRQRMRYGYSDETAPQIWERDLRALLKAAEAAKEYRSSQQVQMLNAIEYDAPKVERQRIAKKALDAALTELEAQE